jgi:hypothetical protein
VATNVTVTSSRCTLYYGLAVSSNVGRVPCFHSLYCDFCVSDSFTCVGLLIIAVV